MDYQSESKTFWCLVYVKVLANCGLKSMEVENVIWLSQTRGSNIYLATSSISSEEITIKWLRFLPKPASFIFFI